jgi:hypothetical protein
MSKLGRSRDFLSARKRCDLASDWIAPHQGNNSIDQNNDYNYPIKKVV